MNQRIRQKTCHPSVMISLILGVYLSSFASESIEEGGVLLRSILCPEKFLTINEETKRHLPMEETYPALIDLPKDVVLDRFDWNLHVITPPKRNITTTQKRLEHFAPRGSQLNKFNTLNRHYGLSQNGKDSYEHAWTHSSDERAFSTDAHTLLYASMLALSAFSSQNVQNCEAHTHSVDGKDADIHSAPFRPAVAVEFGAGVFKSTNLIAGVFSRSLVFAFDTFAGLPEAWDRPGVRAFPVGTFGPRNPITDRQPPFPVHDNVVCIKGLFRDTLPRVVPVLRNSFRIALVHVDSDLYASAVECLTPLLPLLEVGTVIVFDEFYNVEGWRDGEYKAYMELLVGNGFECKVKGFNVFHEQVVFQVTKVPFISQSLSK